MRLATLAALLLSLPPALAQSLPVLPQNPPGLNWQQVRTPHFQVIFPAGLDTAAWRTAARLEALHEPGAATLGVSPRPISVVLQNQTTVSNGFVTFLPRHAEFFTTPEQGQGLGTVDWLDGLAVHEYRHVGQFEKARTGIGRVLGPLLGDGGLGVAAVGVPQWFFEGDAVGTETALTRSGRGRIPAFNVGLRANLLSGRLYSYQKAVNGSLRDNVPDWYVLGYFMTSYLKAHYGPGVWAKALDRYYKFPFYPFSFSRGIRQTTGLTVEQLYARTMQEVDSTWRTQQATQPAPTPATELSGQAATPVFTQYQYPQYVTENTVLALKTGLDNIPQFVLLGRQGSDPLGREKRVFAPGQLNLPEQLSVAAGRAVWPEFRSNPRYGQRVYSELKVLDVASGRVRRLGRGGRFAAASLSPGGRRLVAVRTDAAYQHRLVLLDADTGAERQTLPNPRNDFYQQPRFLPDGRRVVAVALSAAGKTLQVLDPETGQTRNLLPVANINLSNPQPWGDYVLYNSPQSGVDNIYAVALVSGQTFQVTSRPFGAYHAAVAPGGRTLAFHEVRATGARVVEMPLDPATWTPIPTPPSAANPSQQAIYAEILAAQEPAGRRLPRLLARPDSAQAEGVGNAAFATGRYRPLAHAFNVFSYGVVQSPAGNAVALGLRSQDYLNTTQGFAGLSYDANERTLAGLAALSYQALPVVLDATAQYGGRDVTIALDRRRPLDSLARDQWRYSRLSAGLRLPLTLTRSKYLQALSLSTYYLQERVYDYDLPLRRRSEVGANQPLHALQTSLSYVSQLRLSARDVAPRGGGTLLATWRTTPFGTRLQARQVGVQGSVFAPGLGRHHALRLRLGYQWQDQAQYQFGAAVSFPRGERYVSFDKLRTASLDYSLPLAYPHLALGRVLYVQRLRATLFGDAARGESAIGEDRYRLNYRNVGVDALALFNVLRLRTPIEAGVRVVYDTYRQQWTVEALAFDIRI
ncbi:TolB family protein [uncultured Hymenobacter sp.]|uniref:TolB family protein n=1 Tax=uncultured Hymenobacter sp. TaxID=170016 RepID=UPI0035CAEE75